MRPIYHKALAELLNSSATDSGDRAVACNLRHDRRIGPARERLLDLHRSVGVDAHPRTGLAVKDSVRDYFLKRIRGSFTPDFILPEFNKDNFREIATASNPDGMNGGIELARVVDLTELGTVYLWAEESGIAAFQGYEAESRSNRLKGWLRRFLREEADAVPMILAVVYRRLKRIPYEPAWVTYWDDFGPYVSDTAERWLELIGKENRHTLETPHCLVLLRYCVRDTGTMFRPTQLDAGWLQFHFPSAEDSISGYTMDLAAPPEDTEPFSEFIHQQIAHSSHWTGEIKWTSRDGGLNLREQRAAHYRRLRRFDPGIASGWIEECLD